ncbi:MAG: SIR2 family NAD-dependent protein deacylase [Phycisphaerae bacterium]
MTDKVKNSFDASYPQPVEWARELLSGAKNVFVFTGAGISAESGIPTYRGAGKGFWDGLRVADWATPQGFARNPEGVWDWYCRRRVQLGSVRPNPGHEALAQLQRRIAGSGGSFTLATQNIDGLHQTAGTENVLELHGSLLAVRCSDCSYAETVGPVALDSPACPECGSRLRPDVVWFGEMLPQDTWRAAEQAASECDLLLVVGTSAVVYPAAGLIETALAGGARSIEVNPEPNGFSGLMNVSIRGKSGEVLPQLLGYR